MEQLIKINTNENGERLVSARELHEFLEVGRDFTTWIKGRINKYDFVENSDFTVVDSFHQNGGKGGRPEKEYIITIDMAKELSMVEKNEKGKQARQYFIQCEKQLNENINNSNYIERIEIEKSEISLIDYIANSLSLNNNSKLLLMQKSFEKNGIDTCLLPSYTESKGILKSATELLKQFNIDMSARKFNSILVDKCILKECTRTSGKDKIKVKKFKNLVNLEFGQNQVNPKNPKETQPMYYEGKFKELLTLVLD